MKFKTVKALKRYGGPVTASLAIILLAGNAAQNWRKANFDEITVRRINVVEPDGTLRMTLSGKERLPEVLIKGKPVPARPRAYAGMLFFNDEGSETGGLLFGGRNVDGRPTSTGSLTFDRYEQDQVIQMLEHEEGDQRFSGLRISDRPNGRMDFHAVQRARSLATPAERQAAFAAANAGEAHRITVARENDNSARIGLHDARGRTRLRLQVASDGAASIQFLNEAGKVVKNVGPE